MEDKMKDNVVSYYTLEAMLAREERHIKRLMVLLTIAVIMLFASNAVWLYCWQSYDYSCGEQVVTVDGKEGTANYIGNDGDIMNGESSSNEAMEDAPKEEREVEGDAPEEE